MAWKRREKVAIMEPLSMVNETMTQILREEGDIIIEGALYNFVSLKSLLELRKLDVVFSEVYDASTSIIEGLDLLRKLKAQFPAIDIILHTEIEIPALLIQSNADAIYMKQLGVEGCRASAAQILNAESMVSVLFYEDRKRHYDFEMLSDYEWEVLIMFSQQMSITNIADKKKTDYRRISRMKHAIMDKLKINNNVAFSQLMALAGCKFGEYPPVSL
ncbi:MAG: response regulator transcription factor [Serratia sp.]|jgi:DNA-binding NarL/FixJ family response regulator|nr:response regulator transcription factor [Serratia sp. (in: enterobacteria)]